MNAIKTDLRGKVAVITGAASGIGLALAKVAAKRGMKVALADINQDALQSALSAVHADGGDSIVVKTDVSQRSDLETLRRQTNEQLGPPWLLCNNAGITTLALAWKHTEADWRRAFDINVYGVVNGLLTFLPEMMRADSGHIVNTSSVAGLLTVPGSIAYVASKHAVVGLSETLYRELNAAERAVGVSVLCPGLVRTNILKSSSPDSGQIDSEHALDPMDVAEQTFEAIQSRRFWILTHAHQMAPFMEARVRQALTQANPDLTSIDVDAARMTSGAVGLDLLHTTAAAGQHQ
jgi:short-subunit dehydrogenase